MLKILIFDDNAREAEITYNIIRDFLEREKKEAEVYTFTLREDLVHYVENNKDVNAVFMDILVDDEALGIEMAKEINRVCEDAQIVFLTGYLHYATDIYDTRHIYFVLKTELRMRLASIFEKIEKAAISDNPNMIHIKKGRQNLVLKESQIRYIERDKRISRIYYDNQIYIVQDKMPELEEMLHSPDFIRCHNSYIVNLRHVLKLEQKTIMLKDGAEIPISRARNFEVREKFLNWVQKYM